MHRINLDGITVRAAAGDDTGETDPGTWPTTLWGSKYAGAVAAAGTLDGDTAARTELMRDTLSRPRAARWLTQVAVDPSGLLIAPAAILPADLWQRVDLPAGIPPEGRAHLQLVYFNAFRDAGTAAKILRAARDLHTP